MANKFKVIVEIMVELESNLTEDEAIQEFSDNCQYDFPSIDTVKVIDTEWRDTLTIEEYNNGR